MTQTLLPSVCLNMGVASAGDRVSIPDAMQSVFDRSKGGEIDPAFLVAMVPPPPLHGRDEDAGGAIRAVSPVIQGIGLRLGSVTHFHCDTLP
jgi:hypothetical protein